MKKLSRRSFVAASLALATGGLSDGEAVRSGSISPLLDRPPHFPPRAKRVIWLFQSGGPSQIDLFDHKPELVERHGEELPDSVRRGQRLTGMSGNQSSLPMVGSPFRFAQHGECGAWISELLPHTAQIADRLCFVKSMYTEAINHDPAITFIQTGSQIAGRPSIGAWLSYGLGPANPDLPASIVMVTKNKGGQPLYARLWGPGFLPAEHQGVSFRAGRDAVLYLNDPEGLSPGMRRRMLDAQQALDRDQATSERDPAIAARIAQSELAWRMQRSVPEATDVSGETDEVFELYGKDSRNPGSYAANCLIARRLVERGVRFIQLFHQGWDHHGSLRGGLTKQCLETDQASAALVLDLARRGLLEDTLVVWGGEFGRTNYSQGKLTPEGFGRDHHPRCFTTWMAGGGIKAGLSYGTTDELGYNLESDGVHIHDLQATILHLMGIDHKRLVFKHQGRRFRLTDVHGRVVSALFD